MNRHLSRSLLFGALFLAQCSSPLLADPPATTHPPVTLDQTQTVTGAKNFTGGLQSGGKAVATQTGTEALTNKTYNGITQTSGTNTFTLSVGTAGLTVPAGLNGSLTPLAYKAASGSSAAVLDGTGDFAENGQGAYLFVSFGGDPEEFHWMGSIDGISWTPLSIYVATGSPNNSCRDPQYIYYRGKWYCVYTESHWNGSTFAQGHTFGIAVSNDLLNWSRLADVDISTWLTLNSAPHNQLIWAPIIALDASGVPYLTVWANGEDRLLFMRLSNPDDMTSWTYVQDVSLTKSGTHYNSAAGFAVYSNGTYYLSGPYDTPQKQGVFSATAPQGPYTWVGDITGFHDESIGLTLIDGSWYGVQNANYSVPEYAPISPGPTGSLGTIVYGFIKNFWGMQRTVPQSNPRMFKFYGAAAASIRTAIQQVETLAARTPSIELPVFNKSYKTSSLGGEWANDDNVVSRGGYPLLVSGSNSGAEATVAVAQSPFFDYTASCLIQQPANGAGIDVTFYAKPAPGSTTAGAARILFGVDKDTLGEPTGYPWIGLRFVTDGGQPDGGRVDLVVHGANTDTTTVLGSHSIALNRCNMRVKIQNNGGGIFVTAWWGSTMIFNFQSVDMSGNNSAWSWAGGDSKTAIVFQQGSDGSDHDSWFYGGSLKGFEK